MKRLLGKPSPSMVVACLALAVALSGVGLAATQLPRNSVGTRQIKNGAVTKKKIARKTIAALHGAKGAKGATGPQGSPGAQGVPGAQGPPGPFPNGNMPAGTTVRGNYGLAGVGNTGTSAISFGFQMSAAPTPHYIKISGVPPPQCPGDSGNPQALPGNLCIYESGASNVSSVTPGSNRWGAVLFLAAALSTANAQSRGTWAATAP